MKRPSFDILLVEGATDEAVARALLKHVRIDTPDNVIVAGGNPAFLTKLEDKYVKASRHIWVFALADTEGRCVKDIIHASIGSPPRGLVARFAVRMVESWLLADKSGLAKWLAVSEADVPSKPDTLDNPKQKLLQLVKRSSKSSFQSMLPDPLARARIGPGYVEHIENFVRGTWDINAARKRSPSLDRAMLRLIRCREQMLQSQD